MFRGSRLLTYGFQTGGELVPAEAIRLYFLPFLTITVPIGWASAIESWR